MQLELGIKKEKRKKKDDEQYTWSKNQNIVTNI